jgi:hypothetical protein
LTVRGLILSSAAIIFVAASRNQQLEELLIATGGFDLIQIDHDWPRQRGSNLRPAVR